MRDLNKNVNVKLGSPKRMEIGNHVQINQNRLPQEASLASGVSSFRQGNQSMYEGGDK